MKHHVFKVLLGLSLLTPVTPGCSPETQTGSSDLDGAIPGSAFGKTVPKAKNSSQLGAFSKGMVSGFDKYHGAYASAAKYKSLQRSLYHTIDEAGGVPRSQVETALEVLVAPTTTLCGGASCARVFGLTENEVSKFLDDSREIIAKTPVQSQQDKIKLRDLLLASLTREDDILNPGKPLKAILAELPVIQPRIVPRSQASRQLEDPKNILSEGEIKQIQAYSHIFSTQLRAVEIHHVENLLRAGYSPTAIHDAKSRVATINRALAKLPTMPGTTYRGITHVSDSALLDLFSFRRGKRLISLSQKNLPALTSTSWNIKVAEAFAIAPDKSKHSIIYIIKQRTGKTIEKISRYPAEEEVLIPSNALFQIGQIAYINREKRVLSVELIQVLKP
jgi:hypothetical protein